MPSCMNKNTVSPGRYRFKLPDWASGYLVDVSPSPRDPSQLVVKAAGLKAPVVRPLSEVSDLAQFEALPSF